MLRRRPEPWQLGAAYAAKAPACAGAQVYVSLNQACSALILPLHLPRLLFAAAQIGAQLFSQPLGLFAVLG